MCEFAGGRGGFAAEQVNDKSYCIIFLPSHAAEHDGIWGTDGQRRERLKNTKTFWLLKVSLAGLIALVAAELSNAMWEICLET